MRVEISHKFIIGFLVVVISVVLVDLAIPFLGIAPEFEQVFTITCALVVGLVIGTLFSRAFTANIRRLTAAAGRISRGNLAEEVVIPNGRFPDETGDLASAMNQIQQSLRGLVGEIRSMAVKVAGSSQALSGTALQVSASASEVAGTVDQISKGAETQAEMVEESNRLFREVSMSIDLVASAARKLVAAATSTVETARSGGVQAEASLGNIRQVMTEVESSGEQMVGFVARLQQIGSFVEIINGIAQKTNLLALNATIEAARAGEYGRGFAVVAEEIRELADSTTASAGEITRLVETIRNEGQRVQASMAQAIEEMENGRAAVDRTGQAFNAITENAEGTRAKAHSITELADQQIAAAERITRAIDEIDKVVSDNAAATQQVSAATQQQSAAMEELAESAKQLSVLSEAMLNVVRQFRLSEPRS